MTGLSLFSGIGGLDLAFEWAGGTVVAMCEIDPFCRVILKKHWPNVTLFGDIKGVKSSDVATIDVIYGGFPCQPFSVAGKQQGRNDPRYLWPEFSRLVKEIKPRWVVGENVPGIIKLAADDVCKDLEHAGYSVGVWNFEAAAVGAPHRRSRVFFVAHAGRTLQSRGLQRREIPTKITGKHSDNAERPSSALFSPDPNRRRGLEPGLGGGFDGLPSWLDRSWEQGIPRVAKGAHARATRLKALGNAVVPQQAYPIFKAIAEVEKEATG